jgi:hypothetical protein
MVQILVAIRQAAAFNPNQAAMANALLKGDATLLKTAAFIPVDTIPTTKVTLTSASVEIKPTEQKKPPGRFDAR